MSGKAAGTMVGIGTAGRGERPGRGRTPTPHAGHAVQFYESDEFLQDSIAGFLADGFAAGQPLLVLAMDSRRPGLSRRFANRGYDFEGERRQGLITFVDASAALASFMVEDRPDPDRFSAAIGSLIERSLDSRSDAGLRAYGEMVDVLWRRGLPEAAVDVERLWNELLAQYPVSLLCAYALDNFRGAADALWFDEICHSHAQVRPAESFAAVIDDVQRGREIARLQQRALALEVEIERRTALENSLREAVHKAERADRAKSEFLAVMSHELRTPLNAIIGYQDLLDQEVAGPLVPEQRTYLTRIRSGAQQLLRLIDQVLNLSRLEAGHESVCRQPTDVVALVNEACALIQPTLERKGLRLDIASSPPAVQIETDPDKLRQILLNLLSNAAKFTTEGGVSLRVEHADDKLVFQVSDTGGGIAEEDLARIFEPFVQLDCSPTRAHGGTGLGLAVSRDLARLLNGELFVASTPGTGSTFTLVLPARSELRARSPDAAGPRPD